MGQIDLEVSNAVFNIGELPKLNKWWSQTLPIHSGHGYSFFYPRHIHCTIDFQNLDNQEEVCTLPVADIYVMGRSGFFLWAFTTTIAVIAIIVGVINIVCLWYQPQ